MDNKKRESPTKSPPIILIIIFSFLLLEEKSIDELLVSHLTLDSLRDSEELAKLSGRKGLPEGSEDLSELIGGDEALAFGVEDLERLEELLLSGGLFHLGAHHGDELGEVELAVMGAVGLVPGLVELVVRNTNTVLLEERSALGLGDGLGTAREHLESLLELGNLVLAKGGIGHTVNVSSFPASRHFLVLFSVCECVCLCVYRVILYYIYFYIIFLYFYLIFILFCIINFYILYLFLCMCVCLYVCVLLCIYLFFWVLYSLLFLFFSCFFPLYINIYIVC